MIQKLKSFFSIFFLAVFLFPTLVKEVHIVNHEKRFYCDANETQHLHTQHHDCTLCDFVIPIVSAPSTITNDFSPINFAKYIFPHAVEIYFSSSQLSFASLRAPPVIS